MGLASHVAVKAKDSSKSIFDVWKHIFDANIEDRTYSQQDYFNAMNQLTGSEQIASAFDRFSTSNDLDNQLEIASWFKDSEISTINSKDYPKSVVRHWGKQVIYNLMQSHCKSISFNSYDDYVKTYPIDGCNSFKQSIEIQFVGGFDIFRDGLNAYNLLREKCDNAETVLFQDRKKVDVAEIQCLETIKSSKPYMKLQAQL